MSNIHIESDFEYKGYRCIVSVNVMCIRCGYVLLKSGHPLYGKGGDDIDVYCHGGITCSANFSDITWNNNDKEWWAVGFDCCHFGDKLAVDEAIEYGLVKRCSPIVESMRRISDEIDGINPCSNVYCQEELKIMVDQMEEIVNAKEK